MNPNCVNAMILLKPLDKWEITPDDPNSLIWRGYGPPPTEAEILDAIKEIELENLVSASRKIWENVSDFWNEFSNNEKYAIEVSQDPTLIILRADLKLWLKDVWSDDPRIQFAVGKLIELGILSEERKTQILTKTS